MDDALKTLARDARDLQGILRRQARRPFVLEITGTPKAGKTTLIGMIATFFRDCDWRVHVLKERAADCPLPMKGHFFFNTWTTGTMLAGLLDAIDRDHDLVILDRGIFDALIWLHSQRKEGQASAREQDAFETFVMLPRWRSLIDAVCVLKVPPTTAMSRENHNRLLRRSGSIMNPPRLRQFNQALDSLQKRHKSDFSFLALGNAGEPSAGAKRIVRRIIKQAKSWADPKIAVLPRANAAALFSDQALRWTSRRYNRLVQNVEYRRRSEVEDRREWVQLVACGIQTHDNRVFLVVRRSARDDVRRRRVKTAMIWRGCHLVQPNGAALSLGYLKQQLLERLRDDLHLAQPNSNCTPLGFVWDGDGKDACHLGLMFNVKVSGNLAEFLDERQLKTNGRGYNMESSFVNPEKLARDVAKQGDYTLEEWSKLVLQAKWLTR